MYELVFHGPDFEQRHEFFGAEDAYKLFYMTVGMFVARFEGQIKGTTVLLSKGKAFTYTMGDDSYHFSITEV